jgi:hypothetical protein
MGKIVHDRLQTQVSLTLIAAGVAGDEFCYVPYHTIYDDPAILLTRMSLDFFHRNSPVCHSVKIQKLPQ